MARAAYTCDSVATHVMDMYITVRLLVGLDGTEIM